MKPSLAITPSHHPFGLPDHLSARRLFFQWQLTLSSILFILWLIWLIYDGIEALLASIFFYMLLVLVISVHRVYLVTLSIVTDVRMASVVSNDLASLDQEVLPLYTILVPLYKETSVLPHLMDSLMALDYPAEKLDIILLLEEDDGETIAAATRYSLPPHVRLLIVSNEFPKTKPRACNVGLANARGKFLVIFDAEDRPERDQLKKALVAFQRSSEQVICVQSRLNFYNSRQNLLTRLFTLEYSFWFDVFLPALAATRAPVPLGGTSNHFRTEVLRTLSGWDAFNVAEDCDLGIRLVRAGYQTVVINSTTWEEATSRIDNWIRQRSRWIKGYLQTYLVHMRDPLSLIRSIGWKNFLSFQLIVGGVPLVLLLAPVFWLLMLIYHMLHRESAGGVFLQLLTEFTYGLEVISIVLCNFALFYFALCGALVRGNHDLVKYILLTPLYVILQCVAAWKGCIQFLTKPHHWEKTIHGHFPQTISAARPHHKEH